MKITGWFIFVALNFWLLFFYTKNVNRRLLIKAFILTVPIACILSILIALGMRLIHFDPSNTFTDAFFSVLFSVIIISMVNCVNQLFLIGLDGINSFHQKNNADNLNRQPIKFFATRQPLITRAVSIIWFLGTALMLYGTWFDMHVQ